jgi:GNAT superfamily N-acetyltransferase
LYLERGRTKIINYEVIHEKDVNCIKDLCNDLMSYQKSVAHIHPEFFDSMCFETRVLPAIKSSKANHIIVAKDGDQLVGYAYSTIAPKVTYSGGFATLQCDAFFDFDSVKTEDVGCLSQFYIKESYRNKGIGSVLFDMSMDWLGTFDHIADIFIFVSNGNDGALRFYLNKGFKVCHQILDGFITVLRN